MMWICIVWVAANCSLFYVRGGETESVGTVFEQRGVSHVSCVRSRWVTVYILQLQVQVAAQGDGSYLCVKAPLAGYVS